MRQTSSIVVSNVPLNESSRISSSSMSSVHQLMHVMNPVGQPMMNSQSLRTPIMPPPGIPSEKEKVHAEIAYSNSKSFGGSNPIKREMSANAGRPTGSANGSSHAREGSNAPSLPAHSTHKKSVASGKRCKVSIPPYIRGMARAVNEADESQFPELAPAINNYAAGPPVRALKTITTEINNDKPLGTKKFRLFRAALAETRQHLHGVKADILQSNTLVSKMLNVTMNIDSRCTESNIAMVKLFPRIKELHNYLLELAGRHNIRDGDPIVDRLITCIGSSVLSSALDCIKEMEDVLSEGKKQYIESTIGSLSNFTSKGLHGSPMTIPSGSPFSGRGQQQQPTRFTTGAEALGGARGEHSVSISIEMTDNDSKGSYGTAISPPLGSDAAAFPPSINPHHTILQQFSSIPHVPAAPVTGLHGGSGSTAPQSSSTLLHGVSSGGPGSSRGISHLQNPFGSPIPPPVSMTRVDSGISRNSDSPYASLEPDIFGESINSEVFGQSARSRSLIELEVGGGLRQLTACNSEDSPGVSAAAGASNSMNNNSTSHSNGQRTRVGQRYSGAAQILFPERLVQASAAAAAAASGITSGLPSSVVPTSSGRANSFVLHSGSNGRVGSGGAHRNSEVRRGQQQGNSAEEDIDSMAQPQDDDEVVLKESYGMFATEALSDELRHKICLVNSDLSVHLAHLRWLFDAQSNALYFNSDTVLEDQAMRRLWADCVGRHTPGCFAEEFEASALLRFPEWSREAVMKVLNFKNCGVVSLYGVQRLLKVWGPLLMLDRSFLYDISAGLLSLSESFDFHKETFPFRPDASPGDFVVTLSDTPGEVQVVLLRAVEVDPNNLAPNRPSLISLSFPQPQANRPRHKKEVEQMERKHQDELRSRLLSTGASSYVSGDEEVDLTLCTLEAIPFCLSHETGAWTVHRLSHEEFETISEACEAFPEIFVRPCGEVYGDPQLLHKRKNSLNSPVPSGIMGTTFNTVGNSSPLNVNNATVSGAVSPFLPIGGNENVSNPSGIGNGVNAGPTPVILNPQPAQDRYCELPPLVPTCTTAADGRRGNAEYSALHRACYRNNELFVQGLLRRGADAIVNTGVVDHTICPNFCWTPLLCAVNNPNSDPKVIVERLLELGADPTIADDAQCTPLYYAITNHYAGAVRALLQHSPSLHSSPWTNPLLLSLGAHHFHCRELDIRLLANLIPNREVIQAIADHSTDYVVVRLALDILQGKLNGVVLQDRAVETEEERRQKEKEKTDWKKQEKDTTSLRRRTNSFDRRRTPSRGLDGVEDSFVAPTPNHVDDGLPYCYMEYIYRKEFQELRLQEEQDALSRIIRYHGTLCQENYQEVNAALLCLYHRCYFLSVRRFLGQDFLTKEEAENKAKSLLTLTDTK